MPIKLPLLAALKNVSICYNDGRFSCLPLAPDRWSGDVLVPSICSLIKPSRTLVVQQVYSAFYFTQRGKVPIAMGLQRRKVSLS